MKETTGKKKKKKEGKKRRRSYLCIDTAKKCRAGMTRVNKINSVHFHIPARAAWSSQSRQGASGAAGLILALVVSECIKVSGWFLSRRCSEICFSAKHSITCKGKSSLKRNMAFLHFLLSCYFFVVITETDQEGILDPLADATKDQL